MKLLYNYIRCVACVYNYLSVVLLNFSCLVLKIKFKFKGRYGRSQFVNMPHLLEFTETISKWVDEGSPVDVTYLDFQKAMGDSIANWVSNWLN